MQHKGLYKYLLISVPPPSRSTCLYTNFAPFLMSLRGLTIRQTPHTFQTGLHIDLCYVITQRLIPTV